MTAPDQKLQIMDLVSCVVMGKRPSCLSSEGSQLLKKVQLETFVK